MKQKFFKISITLIIIIALTTVILPTISDYGNVHAGTGEDILDVLMTALSLFIGLTTLGIRILCAALGTGVSAIISGIAGLGSDLGGDTVITPVAIFFNKLSILDVDFFDFNPPNMGSDSIVVQFRTTIATWYYIMRALATGILLIVLIYVGIRMAIATVASEKALYKKMLVDWVASIALIYLLHYFIIIIITINGLLVKAIESTASDLFTSNNFNDFTSDLMLYSVSPFNGFTGIVCTILFLYMMFQTVKFMFIYIKRMMTVGFLIIIAPLITLTYSMDKMGDGKAQALGTWLKEFCYNILIQPFHCILYLAFVYAAIKIMTDSGGLGDGFFSIFPTSGYQSLGAGILAIMCLNFVDKGEDIIRKIFGFSNASSLASTAIAAGVVTNMANNATKLGQTGVKMVNSAKKTDKLIRNTFRKTGNAANKVSNKLGERAKNLSDKRLTNRAANIARKNGNSVRDNNGNEFGYEKEKIAAIKQRLLSGRDVNTNEETDKSRRKDARQEKRTQRTENLKQKARERQEKKTTKKNDKIDDIATNMYLEKHPEIDKKAPGFDREAIKELAKQNADIMKAAGEKYENTRMKNRISKAQGYLQDHGITYKNAKKYIKDQVPGAMALVGFTANFAGTGKVITSIIAGTGAYEGASEFLKNTKGTMRENADGDFAMVANASGQEFDKSAKQQHIAQTARLGDLGVYNGSNVQKFANDVIKHFQSVASQLQDKSGQKASISSMDSSALMSQTMAFMSQGMNGNQAFEAAFNQSKFADTDISAEDKESLKNQTMEYAKFTANASLYSKIQQGRQTGLAPTDLASGTVVAAAATMTAAAVAPMSGATHEQVNIVNEETTSVDQVSLNEAEEKIDDASRKAQEELDEANKKINKGEVGTKPIPNGDNETKDSSGSRRTSSDKANTDRPNNTSNS